MKFLLLMYNAEDAFSDDDLKVEQRNAVALCNEIHAKGQFVSGTPLYPVETAKSLRVRDGLRVVSDGPFAETKEQLGGYVLVDVDTIEEAIDIASRFPSAKVGTVEVRAIEEI
ncbi:YciI family protein [Botrimarina mediterranea]|uniref:YCII-related domain protein n=1 Tax=Botrimarina mediterranea TaxID=2528022 RepID=A0A518K3E8_9BACT|nr:YciI family protein [Botrimarina mediterranea]QDV72307.1 YCII-related domain protein [Botrimarina mediterranea]QDV76851.1 YCII-related domain protein [Planctomycetes bacterium K2D]